MDVTQQAGPERPEGRAVSWTSFLSTYLPAMVLALGTGIAAPVIPILAKSFDVGFGLASGVITSHLIGGMVGTLPTGWLIDRIGRRPMLIAGPLLTAAMALLVMTAQSFPELLAYRFVEGWASQMWLLARLTGIAHGATAGQRGRQVSWMYGMDNVGKLAGPLVGGFVADGWGIRAPFAFYALLALAALIPTVSLVKEPERRLPVGSGTGQQRPAMSIPQLVLPRLDFFGVALFSSLARGPIFAGVLYLYAAFAYDLDARSIGILATAASAISMPIGFTAGWMMDRFGRKRAMVPGFFGVTVTMLLLAVTAFLHLSLGWYIAAFLAGVFTQSLTGGSVQTIGTDVAPPEARGMFLGLWRFTGQLGTALSPVIFAYLAERTGYGSSFVYVATAALVVALLLVIRIPETGRERAPATAHA